MTVITVKVTFALLTVITSLSDIQSTLTYDVCAIVVFIYFCPLYMLQYNPPYNVMCIVMFTLLHTCGQLGDICNYFDQQIIPGVCYNFKEMQYIIVFNLKPSA